VLCGPVPRGMARCGPRILCTLALCVSAYWALVIFSTDAVELVFFVRCRWRTESQRQPSVRGFGASTPASLHTTAGMGRLSCGKERAAHGKPRSARREAKPARVPGRETGEFGPVPLGRDRAEPPLPRGLRPSPASAGIFPF
jgi:hypothetical protein